MRYGFCFWLFLGVWLWPLVLVAQNRRVQAAQERVEKARGKVEARRLQVLQVDSTIAQCELQLKAAVDSLGLLTGEEKRIQQLTFELEQGARKQMSAATTNAQKDSVRRDFAKGSRNLDQLYAQLDRRYNAFRRAHDRAKQELARAKQRREKLAKELKVAEKAMETAQENVKKTEAQEASRQNAAEERAQRKSAAASKRNRKK